MFEPLAGARRLENGTLLYQMSDREVNWNQEDEKLRRLFERMNDFEVSELTEEDTEELRVAYLEESEALKMPTEEWN